MSSGTSQQFCVRWNSHLGSLGAAFPQLLAGQRFVDVTLACEGHQLHCHRLVLAACSTYFESLLGENPCKHPIIILPRDIKLWEIQALVDFMYKGEVNVSQAGLSDLLKCAEILQIRGLCGSDAALHLNQMTSATSSPPASSTNMCSLAATNGTDNTPTTTQVQPPSLSSTCNIPTNIGCTSVNNSSDVQYNSITNNIDVASTHSTSAGSKTACNNIDSSGAINKNNKNNTNTNVYSSPHIANVQTITNQASSRKFNLSNNNKRICLDSTTLNSLKSDLQCLTSTPISESSVNKTEPIDVTMDDIEDESAQESINDMKTLEDETDVKFSEYLEQSSKSEKLLQHHQNQNEQQELQQQEQQASTSKYNNRKININVNNVLNDNDNESYITDDDNFITNNICDADDDDLVVINDGSTNDDIGNLSCIQSDRKQQELLHEQEMNRTAEFSMSTNTSSNEINLFGKIRVKSNENLFDNYISKKTKTTSPSSSPKNVSKLESNFSINKYGDFTNNSAGNENPTVFHHPSRHHERVFGRNIYCLDDYDDNGDNDHHNYISPRCHHQRRDDLADEYNDDENEECDECDDCTSNFPKNDNSNRLLPSSLKFNKQSMTIYVKTIQPKTDTDVIAGKITTSIEGMSGSDSTKEIGSGNDKESPSASTVKYISRSNCILQKTNRIRNDDSSNHNSTAKINLKPFEKVYYHFNNAIKETSAISSKLPTTTATVKGKQLKRLSSKITKLTNDYNTDVIKSEYNVNEDQNYESIVCSPNVLELSYNTMSDFDGGDNDENGICSNDYTSIALDDYDDIKIDEEVYGTSSSMAPLIPFDEETAAHSIIDVQPTSMVAASSRSDEREMFNVIEYKETLCGDTIIQPSCTQTTTFSSSELSLNYSNADASTSLFSDVNSGYIKRNTCNYHKNATKTYISKKNCNNNSTKNTITINCKKEQQGLQQSSFFNSSDPTPSAVVLRNPRSNQPRTYSTDSLYAALMDVKSGESIYRASQIHKVPRKTLRNWMKRWHIKSAYPMPRQLKQAAEKKKLKQIKENNETNIVEN